jgi:hypothetical protein
MAAAGQHLLALSDEHRQALESWLVEFDKGWKEGRLGEAVRQLPPPGSPLRYPTLVELVKVDLEKQWERGRRVPVESYLKDYPELGTPETSRLT